MSATVASGRVFDAFLGPDLGERTLYHGHSYGGNALAAAVALRHLELIDAWDVLANVRDPLRRAARPARRPHRAAARGARGAPARAHGRRRARAAAPTGCAGAGGSCAAAVERGVLLRPLGDVVVLMPPLTITSPELHRIVHALADAHRRGRDAVTTAVTLGRLGRRSEARRDPRRRAVARAARPRRRRPDGKLAPTAGRSCRSRRTTTSGSPSTPRCVAAAHDALDRWGTGAGSARLIVGSRPVHGELETRARRRGRAPSAAVLFPTGFAANLGVLTTFGGPGMLVCSDELNHASIIDGCRLARADVAVYRHGDLDHLDELAARPRAGRRAHRRHATPSSRWTATSRRVDALVERVRATTARCSCSTRPTRCSAPTLDASPADVDVLRVGTLSKTLGALGGFVAGPGAFTDLLVNRARSYIFTTALDARRHRRRARRAAGARARPRATRCVARLRANVDRLRPGHPSPIVPVRVRRRGATRSTPRPRCSSAGCSCPRSGRRPSRRARRACGSRSRPRTPTTRSTGWPPRSAELFP